MLLARVLQTAAAHCRALCAPGCLTFPWFLSPTLYLVRPSGTASLSSFFSCVSMTNPLRRGATVFLFHFPFSLLTCFLCFCLFLFFSFLNKLCFLPFYRMCITCLSYRVPWHGMVVSTLSFSLLIFVFVFVFYVFFVALFHRVFMSSLSYPV